MDGIEAFQALLAETLHGMTPREFRDQIPKDPAGLVIDSQGFFDAVTRSCCSQAISLERRLHIDYAIAKETTVNQSILVFWVKNLRMSADCLTKLKGDTKTLYEILDGETYEITMPPIRHKGKTERSGLTRVQKGSKQCQASPVSLSTQFPACHVFTTGVLHVCFAQCKTMHSASASIRNGSERANSRSCHFMPQIAISFNAG